VYLFVTGGFIVTFFVTSLAVVFAISEHGWRDQWRVPQKMQRGASIISAFPEVLLQTAPIDVIILTSAN
jgi:hypothetical protein